MPRPVEAGLGAADEALRLDLRPERVGDAAVLPVPEVGGRLEPAIGPVDQLAELPGGIEVAVARREDAVVERGADLGGSIGWPGSVTWWLSSAITRWRATCWAKQEPAVTTRSRVAMRNPVPATGSSSAGSRLPGALFQNWKSGLPT